MRPSVVLISSLLLTCSVDAKTRPSSRAFLVRPTVRSIPRGGEYSYDTSSGYPEEEDPYLSNRPSDDYYGDGGVYQDERDYQDYDRGMVDRRRSSNGGNVLSDLPQMIKTGNRKIGLPMLGIGAVLTALGVSLFFNKTLMRLGNLFFVAGVPMTIGAGRTAGYFLQSKKMRATGCLSLGIFLVFIGWPVIGIGLEAFGMLNLFGNMFPLALAVLKTMPVIGPLLRGDGGSAKSGRDRYRAEDDDDYYGGRGNTYDRGSYDDGQDNDDYNRGYY